MSAVSRKSMPASSAASTTARVPSRSTRRPKLLQPSPTTETLSSPSFRCGRSAMAGDARPSSAGTACGPPAPRNGYPQTRHRARRLGSRAMSTVAFFPEGAFGPTNNCVGIGDVLRRRGHRVVFIVEESFAGSLEQKGFEERLMRLAPPPDEPEVPGQFWKDFIRETAPVFRKPTIEQLGDFIAPTFQALIDGATYVDDRVREILGELEPDVIVEDNVVAFPALPASGRPWVRSVSCNPTEVRDPDVPPPFSGCPVDDRAQWDAYWDELRRTHGEMHAAFSALCEERGAPALPDLEFMHASPWLNLTL